MTDSGPLILLIEDELPIRRFLRAALSGSGYRLIEAVTAQAGLLQAATQPPDVILLDLGLPDFDGLEVAKRLREWSNVPIIVLSARGQEQDKVAALDSGADDYLTKPFGNHELLARIRSALRRSSMGSANAAEPALRVGDLHVDLARRQVWVAEREVHLTPIQYSLLATLVRYAGRVVTHRQLLREVWGPNAEDEAQYVRVYMSQLRHKIEADPAHPRYLLTEPGIGYRLKSE